MKRKRDIEKKNEGIHINIEKKPERERERKRIYNSSNNRDGTFDMSLDTHTSSC
jgi:hypothetical protein